MTRFLEHPVVLIAFLLLSLAVLLLVAAKTGLLGMLDRHLNRRQNGPTGREQGEVSGEIVAVIAAAASMMLDHPVHVRRIRMFTDETGNAWTSVGRLNIMASHTIARRKSQR